MTQVKVCGVKTPQMARVAVQAGADFVGILCHHESKRYVSVTDGQAISAAVREAGAIPVAVCVEHSAEEMRKLCDAMDVSVVQLHGDRCRAEHVALPQDIARIYVLNVDHHGQVVNQQEAMLTTLQPERDFILFDGLVGGSGARITLDQVREAAHGMRFFIAGGLDAQHVVEVIAEVHPDGVDVSSGVEDASGEKSSQKIQDFIAAVRSCDLAGEAK